MKIRYVLWLSACIFLSAMSPTLAAAKGPKANAVPNLEPRLDILGALAASGPHASFGDQSEIFERLVGSWDVEYMDILKDGRQQHRTGQFIVAWVLDGRAIEDVWIVFPAEPRQEREVYADLRYFDSKTRSWPTVFIDPEHASMARFTGGTTSDGRIVLQTSDLGHPQNRWSFTDIGPDTCVFRDEFSSDGGESWKLQSEYHMTRRHGPASR